VNRPDKGIVTQGKSLDIQIGGRYTGSTEPKATADIVDLSFDSQVVPTVVDGLSLNTSALWPTYYIL
jgi:hypothetical protein